MKQNKSASFTGIFLGTASLMWMGGCSLDPGGFPAGVYSGEIPCILELANQAHDLVQEPFTTELVVEIGPSDSFEINGVPVELGAEHVRSLPNADLSFEIVDIGQSRREIVIHYEPRPTLTGIEVTGDLIETYRWENDRLVVDAEADLTVTNIDGSTEFLIGCDGGLTDNPTDP